MAGSSGGQGTKGDVLVGGMWTGKPDKGFLLAGSLGYIIPWLDGFTFCNFRFSMKAPVGLLKQ